VGIPGAIGIKLHSPDKTVIAFTGDGGSMYTIQALYTAKRYGIGAKFVVFNNGFYQLLRDNIEHYWSEEEIAPHEFPDCFALGNIIDYVSLAQSLGVNAAKLENICDVDKAVQALFANDEAFLLEVKVE